MIRETMPVCARHILLARELISCCIAHLTELVPSVLSSKPFSALSRVFLLPSSPSLSCLSEVDAQTALSSGIVIVISLVDCFRGYVQAQGRRSQAG